MSKTSEKTKTKTQPTPFLLALGRHLQELRQQAGERQEFVAFVARRWGLPWSANTIAQLESGRRDLSVREWLLLPSVLSEALRTTYTYSALLPPNNNESLALTDMTSTPAYALRDLVEEQGRRTELWDQLCDRPLTRQLRALNDPKNQRPPTAPTYDQMTYKAARALGVAPDLLLVAAERKWGRSMMQERDERLKVAGAELILPRRAQALRGHITRQLLDELRPVLTTMGLKVKGAASVKKATARRTRTD